ncbi:unnamed protein product [Hermetia illucens]|uniref:Large ribosomal subunit protein mL44 n=1 Tax=Hermetia illucens TaxID=343691 RepID=A0A7R8V6S0_HERIL|nr:unnamed protein product [Hermetia illucens]
MFLSKHSVRVLRPLYPLFVKEGQTREIKRWVAPVLKEVNKRKKKMGPEPERPRSSFIEWNYNAELFAFNKRLKEDMDLAKLQQAFVHRSYIIQEEQKQRANGETIINGYTEGFLKFFLPKMPASLVASVQKQLTSDQALAYLAENLGMGDLVLSSEFPLQEGTLADTFKAVVGSLLSSSGEEKAYTFVRDFVCTQLNQKDLAEWIEIEKPFEQLKEVCNGINIGEPEPRLIGESAKNTVLAAYNVGIYSDKKLIGSGFGESIATAIDVAAYNALRELWGFPENMKPFDFNIQIEKVSKMKVVNPS